MYATTQSVSASDCATLTVSRPLSAKRSWAFVIAAFALFTGATRGA